MWILLLPQIALAGCDGEIFRGGVSLDTGTSYTAQVDAHAEIYIGGELCPLVAHVGMQSEVFVAFQIDEVFYLLNSDDMLVEYHGDNPASYRSQITLTESMQLDLFAGVVGAAIDQVKLYVAYTIDGEFIMDSLPQLFAVSDSTSLTPQQFSPLRDSTTAAKTASIRVTFDRAINPQSLDNNDLKVFGRWSGSQAGTLALENNNRTLVFEATRTFSAGEAVSVTLPRLSITALDGSSVDQGYSWSFWTETAVAAMDFTETSAVSARVTGSTEQIQTYGAYAGDLNKDGWSDFIVPNEISNDLRVFLNDGTGRYSDFIIVPIAGADTPSPNEGGDFDGDGNIDFAVGSARGDSVHIFLGDGKGGLNQSQNLVVGQRVRGVCLLDFENDGDPDIAATAFEDNRLSLFRNDGAGTFVSAGIFDAGDGEWSCVAADMNRDGMTDIVVGTRTSDELVVLTSNGDGTFTLESRISANGDPWMLAAGDLDRDGDIDIAAANASAQSLTVAMGTGDGSLLPPVSYSLLNNNLGFPLAVDMGDLDGDGDLDIVTADFRTRLFLIHENLGDGTFLRLPNQLLAPGAASCAILHDRDNDGDLDITGIDEVDDLLLLYSH